MVLDVVMKSDSANTVDPKDTLDSLMPNRPKRRANSTASAPSPWPRWIAGFSVMMALAAIHPAGAELVTVEYEAEARTVTGMPFGIEVPRLTVVRGSFTYDSNTSDKSPTDPMRGSFGPVGGWDFRAEFIDKVITDSGMATATTNLFGHTLAFNDGGNKSGRGIMRINDTPDASVEFGLAITGAAKDLPTDQLPANFTFNPPPSGAPHTFVLKDQFGTMLLGFLSFRQVKPEIVLSIQRSGDEVEIVWSSISGKPYALEFSTDLANWSVIRNDLVGLPVTTSVVDDLAVRFPATIPNEGFYRIIERFPAP